MSDNNYLDDVYTVGENNLDDKGDFSGDDSDILCYVFNLIYLSTY